MSVNIFGRSVRRVAKRFQRSERGAIAVEVALVGPIVVMSVLGLAETSLVVSDHQRLQAGAVAGAQYLHDIIDREDGDLLNPTWVVGEPSGWKEGRAMKAARAIIRDAANLDLPDSAIDIQFDCGCLEMTPLAMNEGTELEPALQPAPEPSVETTSIPQPDVTYAMVAEGVSMKKDGTCSTRCSDGTTADMLATITLDYTTTQLRGGEVTRDHALTLRLG